MYSKQQIKEAGETLVKMLDKEQFDNGYVDLVYSTVDDLLRILDGKLKPDPDLERIGQILGNPSPPDDAVARDHILLPGVGFVAVLGQIKDRRIEWYTGDDNDG